jgi:hypothetical protein
MVHSRIFDSLILIIAATILFFLPMTGSIYTFRTDPKTDVIIVTTGVGATTANMTLAKAIYLADQSTLSIYSNNETDVPIYGAYTAATKVLQVNGLSSNITRTLTLTYDYDVLSASAAVNNFLDKLSWIWMLCVVSFVPIGLAAIIISIRRD